MAKLTPSNHISQLRIGVEDVSGGIDSRHTDAEALQKRPKHLSCGSVVRGRLFLRGSLGGKRGWLGLSSTSSGLAHGTPFWRSCWEGQYHTLGSRSREHKTATANTLFGGNVDQGDDGAVDFAFRCAVGKYA